MDFNSVYTWIMLISVGFNLLIPIVLVVLFFALYKMTKRPGIFALVFPMIYQFGFYLLYICYLHKPITLCSMPIDSQFFQIGFRILIALNGISLAIFCLSEIVSLRIRKEQYKIALNGTSKNDDK